MSLPLGSYSINADGTTGVLIITSVDASGDVSGSVFGQPITGLYQEDSDELNFLRIMAADISQFQTYDGRFYAFSTATNEVTYTLAGTFQVFPSAGPVSFFPWSAQLAEKDAKDGKDGAKDGKDGAKDGKEHKDGKESDKEGGKDLESMPPAGDPTGTVGQLAARLESPGQRLATGQAFIGQKERPDVGGRILRGGGEAGASE